MNDDKPSASEAIQSTPLAEVANKEVAFEITEQNILFLKHLQSGMSVKNAYKMAGYEGNSPNEPYNFYWRLKKRLNAVIEADSLDDLRLRSELAKIINLPLKFDKDSTEPGLTVKEKLKAIETADKIVNGKGKMDNKPSITAFVVQRFEKPAEVVEPQPIDVEELK